MAHKVSQTTTLGGTAKDIRIGAVAHGLMMMTCTPNQVPDDQCFEAIIAGVDALPHGTKMFLNSGEFYGLDGSTGNLEMLSRFYAKYPEYADKTFLSVKGGMDWSKRAPDGSLEFLRKSLTTIHTALGPNKKLDLFQPARIDRSIPTEQLMSNLITLHKEGLFEHLGLSECSAPTLRKAHAVHPITAVEIEISPWSYEQRTKDVIEAAKELNIAVIAYSPLGKGFLTGQIKSTSDIPPGDYRSHLTRFKPDVMAQNLALAESLVKIAERKGVTAAQLCIAWVRHLGLVDEGKGYVVPLPGSSKASRTLENLRAGDIVLSAEEMKELNELVEGYDVKGDRYHGQSEEGAHLWA